MHRGRLAPHTLASVAAIAAIVTVTYLPVLLSGNRMIFGADFFQYASRHESVAQSVRRFHTLPLRSHWLGGGFHTITDPEDPTLNPLVLFSIAFGGVNGIKAIGYVAMLVGALSTYAFASRILGYTGWGALFSALVCGTSLFLPSRMAGGNPNEVYGAWLALCLLLIGLALSDRRWPILVLSLVFYTMISDGKLTALMAMFYVGMLCLMAVWPPLRTFAAADAPRTGRDYRPLAYFATAVALAFIIGLPRLLPAFEVIADRGGIAPMIAAHPQVYSAERVNAYSFDELWKGTVGYSRPVNSEMLNRDLLTVGVIPVALAVIAFIVFWRETAAWGIVLLLCCWFILAHHAPVDVLAASWKLPVFNAIYRPYKYFSFQIAFTFAIVAGQSFHLLRKLPSRLLEGLIAVLLIAATVSFLMPRAMNVLSGAFTREQPAMQTPAGFFNVMTTADARPARPLRGLAYFNLRRDIGTLTGFTPVPEATTVAPKYFVGVSDQYVPNPNYRGEAYFLEPQAAVVGAPSFEPNRMSVIANVKSPATLIINQNYHRDWHTDRGTLSEHAGLIAIRLTEPGSYTVHLRYRPRAFYVGLVLAPILLIGVALIARVAIPLRPRAAGAASAGS